MPLYEYHCYCCHKDVEILVMGDEKPKCPNCGNTTALKKQLSTCGFRMEPWHHPSGCKGFTVKGNDGKEVPMFNKYR